MASQWFRSVHGALNTIAAYDAMNIVRKGRIRWLPKTDVLGQAQFIARMPASQPDKSNVKDHPVIHNPAICRRYLGHYQIVNCTD